MKKYILSTILVSLTGLAFSQISLTGTNPVYTQNFNTLDTASGVTSANFPPSWVLAESGASANNDGRYRARNGNTTTGDTYSFGNGPVTDRAFGSIQTSTLASLYGISFTNNTPTPISSINLSYQGEQWRRGNTTLGLHDSLVFQYSTNALSVNDAGATWIRVPSLHFASVNTGTVAAALDGNSFSSLLNAGFNVTVPVGQKIWLRWVDMDASGSDDGLAVDDIQCTFFNNGFVYPTPAASFNPITATYTEISGNVSINLSINPISSGTVSAQAVLKSGNPAWINGYTTQTINFTGGSATASLPVSITDNTLMDGTKTLVFALRNPSAGCSIGTDSLFTLTITDNEGPILLTGSNPVYFQNFNTLDTTSAASGITPLGWLVRENGTNPNADSKYRGNNGSSSSGETYSYGATGNSERALGSLQTLTLFPFFGAKFINNTGNPVSSVNVNYTGEQWRRGNTTAGLHDTLSFQYSLNATDVNDAAATWIKIPALNFISVNTGTVATALNGNATTASINASFNLAVPSGASVWFRFEDVNIVSGNDDGLAIDNFQATFFTNGALVPDTTIQFQTLTSNVSENAGSTAISIQVNPLSATVNHSVKAVLKSGSPAWIGNYTTQTITIPAGSSNANLPVNITNNYILDGNKTLVFALRQPSNGIQIGTDSLFTLTITDDETPIILTGSNPTYSQNFNTLDTAQTFNILIPNGWSIHETGTSTNVDSKYQGSNGNTSWGDTYNFRANGSTDGSLGSLATATLNSQYGALFLNNTGLPISSATVTFKGEQWRRGNTTAGQADSLLFQYSLNADSLNEPGAT
jgi:hypothetical protein